LNWQDHAFFLEGALDAVYRCLHLKDILLRLQQQQIRPTLDESYSLLAKDVCKLLKGDIRHLRVIRGNEFARRTHGAGYKARFFRCAEAVCYPAGKLCSCAVELDDAVSQSVIG